MGVVEILDPQLQIMAYFCGFQKTTLKIKVKITFFTLEAKVTFDEMAADVADLADFAAIALEG